MQRLIFPSQDQIRKYTILYKELTDGLIQVWTEIPPEGLVVISQQIRQLQ